MNDEHLDRVAGALIGAAVGDALGAPYEFDIPGPRDPEMRGGGIGPWEPGEWTDDTQQTICVAQAATANELTPAGVGARLLTWFAEGPKDVGHQTRIVLSSTHDPNELTENARERYVSHPNGCAGNGSLMRTAPVALALLGNDDAIVHAARAISDLTHADPLCGDACILWSIAIDRAVREQRTDGVDEGLAYVSAETRAQWRGWITQARSEPPDRFVPNGYVVTALQAALSAVSQHNNFATALRTAIAIGHDTDTIGSIAGALLGARFGRAAIPLEWQTPLHGWPGLDADDLAALATEVALSR